MGWLLHHHPSCRILDSRTSMPRTVASTSIGLFIASVAAQAGCITLGAGTYNAASAALVKSDGTSYSVASDQRDVPDGWSRVVAESVDYQRSPVGVHSGMRKGWLRDGDLTQLHLDVGVKVWKVGIGYSKLWTYSSVKNGATSFALDGSGNALRLSFAPIPPLSFDVSLGNGKGDLIRQDQAGMTTTPGAELQHRAYGVTVVPWGRGVWNLAFRFDLNTLALPGASTWGPSAEFVITFL